MGKTFLLTVVGLLVGIAGISAIVFGGLFAFYFSPDTLTQLTAVFSTPKNQSERLTEPFIVYGYLPYWTKTKARFPSPISHVSYFSLEIQSDGSILSTPKENQDNAYRAIQKGVLQELKHTLPATQKLELTITMMDQDAIPVFIASQSSKLTFLRDVETLLSTYPIDGINIDIEYNGEVTIRSQEQLADLVKAVHTITQKQTPKRNLSIAMYADSGTIPRITDPKLLADAVDHMIIMAYDFHRRSSPKSGPVAPVFGGSEKKWDGDIVQTLQSFTSKVPSHKILLGIPFYGYEWSVTGTDPQSFTIPKSGQTATYERVMDLIASGVATRYWDETALSPYVLYTDDRTQQLIYYEDAQSIAYKLELVKQANLGGIAIWALGYEGASNELWDTISRSLR